MILLNSLKKTNLHKFINPCELVKKRKTHGNLVISHTPDKVRSLSSLYFWDYLTLVMFANLVFINL